MKRSAGRVHHVVVGVASILLALVLQACESPDDPEPTLQVQDLSGTITGTVLDSNGDPLMGATVSYTGNTSSGDIAQTSTTTNAQGQFALAGIVVSGTETTVDGVASEDPITLTVEPPAGFLSATVAVSPSAQPLTSIGSEQTVFLDEFNADTGPVKLPALATTISGVLRDTGTGTAIGGVEVHAEFVSVAFEQPDAIGVALTYGSAQIDSVVSDADDGSFTLPGVVDDACVRLFVTGFSIDSLSGSAPPCVLPEVDDDPNALELKTNTATITLANVFVTPYSSSDSVPPLVDEVVGVVSPTSDPAALEASVTGVGEGALRVRFSEAMSQVATIADVSVLVGSAPDISAVPLESVSYPTADMLVIETSSALPAGTPVTIQIARGVLRDAAGNGLVLNPAIAYDEFTGSSEQVFELDLRSYDPANPVADAPMVTQRSATVDEFDPAYVTSSAFVDTVADGSEMINTAATPTGGAVVYTNITGTDSDDIEQLNSAGATDALQELVDALAGGGREVLTDIARVRVQSSTMAADYFVSVERAGVQLDVLFFPVATVDGNPQNLGPVSAGSTRYVIDPNGASEFDLIILGRTTGTVLREGDVLKISSRNGNAVLGGTVTLSLQDIAPPTVGVQLLAQVIAATAGSETGDGGGVIIDSEPSPGTVIFPVTPQAADVDDTEAGFENDDFQGEDELLGLSSEALRESAYVAGLGTTETLADATGTEAFLAGTGPRLGLVVSEPIELVPGGVPATPGVDAELSSLQARNAVQTEDGESVDLFTFIVSNVFDFEADAAVAGSGIELAGVIRDLNGETADEPAGAVVSLRDFFPPLMNLAFYDGTNFVFRFHEAVRAQGAIVLENCGYSIDLTAAGIVQSEDDTTFTVPAQMLIDDGAVPEDCFDPALTYDEDAYSLAQIGDLTMIGSVASTQPHGIVTYDTVEDASDNLGTGTGNSWAGWALNGLGMGTPHFAGANVVPPP